jgi:ketosteroid isomerase-like protein
MHRLLLIAVTILAAGCSAENAGAPPPPPVDWHAFDVPRAPPAPPPGPTPSERAVAETYGATLASPGFSLLGARLDADVHFAFPGMGDARGKDAVVHAHDVLLGAFDQRTVVTSRVWRTASEQTLEWVMSGVQARDWMGVPATHKPVVIKGLSLLWTKDDGSISEAHVYFDVATVKAQLGVGPKELLALPAPSMPPAGQAPQIFERTRSPDEDRVVAVARASLDALERTDEAAYLGTMADGVVVETAERAAPMHGKDELRAYFRSIHKAVGQLDTTVDNTWGVAQFAVVEYSLSGEQLGAIGWVPAQRDKVMRLNVVDVTEVRDGKIAHVWRFDNPAQIATPGP